MSKIALALINTIVSALLIFSVLFGFGMGGGFESFSYAGVVEIILGLVILFAGIPALTFGVIYSWMRIFKPFNTLTRAGKVIVFTVAFFVSAFCIYVAAGGHIPILSGYGKNRPLGPGEVRIYSR